MRMKKPPHPGRIIKTVLEAFNLNISGGTEHLGVSRSSLSRIINGLAGISPDMAIRFQKTWW